MSFETRKRHREKNITSRPSRIVPAAAILNDISRTGKKDEGPAPGQSLEDDSGARINWMFSTEQARLKMAKAYPKPTAKESYNPCAGH